MRKPFSADGCSTGGGCVVYVCGGGVGGWAGGIVSVDGAGMVGVMGEVGG